MAVLHAREYASSPQQPVDVAIVGAGPAGLAVALELDRRGHRTLLLESGGRDRFDGPAADLNVTLADGLLADSCTTGRARGLGGTSQLWAGQLLPLSEAELSVQPGDDLCGWPLRAADLKPLWRRAEAFFGTDDAGYELDAWPVGAPRPPDLVAGLQFRFSQFLAEPDMGRRHRPFLAASRSVTALLDATVVGLLTGDRGDVSALEIATRDGGRLEIVARHYVLACGAIETARLLLMSDLARRLPFAGRCFMEHAAVTIPVDRASRRLERFFNSRPIGDRRCLPRLSLQSNPADGGPAINVGIGLGRVAARQGPLPALKILRRAVRSPASSIRGADRRRDVLRAALTVARQSPSVAHAAVAMRRDGHKFVEVVGRPVVGISAEVLPRPDNRVVLSERSDRLGAPVPRLSFTVDAREWAAMRDVADAVAEGFARLGLGFLDSARLPATAAEAVQEGIVVPALHHLGTARMSRGPGDGVVDGDCRVHGTTNLHVAGAAVFPTGGLSNPTLTLVALSIRLGDRLDRELR